MPILQSEKIVHTKVRGVIEGGQTILLEMYKTPELIQSIFIKKDGTVNVTIENPFAAESSWNTKTIGKIKDEYLELLKEERTQVSKWRITGGKAIKGYQNFRQFLGLNISFKF